MFFIVGLSNGIKELGTTQPMVCKNCQRLCAYTILVSYTYLSFFFIPLFRWGKKYTAKTNCCGKVFGIKQILGKELEKASRKGTPLFLSEADLQGEIKYHTFTRMQCPACGFPVTNEFEYCPKCGRKI